MYEDDGEGEGGQLLVQAVFICDTRMLVAPEGGAEESALSEDSIALLKKARTRPGPAGVMRCVFSRRWRKKASYYIPLLITSAPALTDDPRLPRPRAQILALSEVEDLILRKKTFEFKGINTMHMVMVLEDGSINMSINMSNDPEGTPTPKAAGAEKVRMLAE
jgi:hypothetical protein